MEQKAEQELQQKAAKDNAEIALKEMKLQIEASKVSDTTKAAQLDSVMGKAEESSSTSSTNITNMSKDKSIKPIPAVRSQEPTFQRMIMNNTRLV